MAEQKPAVGWPNVAVVAIAIVAVVVIVFKAMNEYQDSKDVVAVLTAVLGPLAGIAAAAFGIKQSSDAKAETKRVKDGARALADKAAARGGGHEFRGAADLGGGEAGLLADLQADLRRLAE